MQTKTPLNVNFPCFYLVKTRDKLYDYKAASLLPQFLDKLKEKRLHPKRRTCQQLCASYIFPSSHPIHVLGPNNSSSHIVPSSLHICFVLPPDLPQLSIIAIGQKRDLRNEIFGWMRKIFFFIHTIFFKVNQK